MHLSAGRQRRLSALVQRPQCHANKLGRFDRLADVIERAKAHRLDVSFLVLFARQKDDLRRRRGLADEADKSGEI